MAGLPPDIPVVDLTPFLNGIMFITDVLEWTGIIPDPISLLLGLFSGRPREQATVQVINRLNSSPNAAARLWAIELSRLLTEDDIVISSGGGAQTILGAIFSQFVNNLEAQGVDAATAGNVGVFSLSRAAQAGAPLEPTLQQPVPAGYFITGPQSIQTLFQSGLAQGQQLGKSGDALNNYAERYVYQHALFHDLAKIGISQTNPTPPAPQSSPSPDGSNPQNPSPTVPPTGQPAPQPNPTGNSQPLPPIPVPPAPDQQGDELTDCCSATATYLYYIASALQQFAASQTSSPSDPCCTSIVGVLTQLNSSLSAIVAILAGPGAVSSISPDLRPVTAALDSIAAAISAFEPVAAGPPPAPVPAPEPGSGPAPPPDVIDWTPLINELEKIRIQHDALDPWMQTLIASGAVPPALASLYQGLDFDGVSSAAAHAVGWALGFGLSELEAVGDRIATSIVKPVLAALWVAFNALVAGFESVDPGLGTRLEGFATGVIGIIDSVAVALFGGAANLIIQGYESEIAGIDTTTDAGVQQVLQILMGRAFEFGVGAHAVALLPEFIYFTKNLGMSHTAALLAEFAGFREVLINSHRPFMAAALGRPATYLYNRNYPTTLPAVGPAMTMWARRILGDADFQLLLSSAGYNSKWQAPLHLSAYRPVSPRALVSALADTPFPTAQLTAILQDNGYSPANVNFMLQVLEYNSIKNVRQSYVSEVETAYKAGVMSDAEFNNALSDLGWSSDAINFVTSKAQLQRRVVLAQKVEAQVVPLVASGNMTAEEGAQQLEAAGVQPWYESLVITLAETKATITAARKAAAAERKLELARQRAETQTAIKQYQDGALDAAGLTVALLAAGVDTIVAAMVVATQTAIRAGRIRLIYGQLLAPQDAAILKDRVDALHAQTNESLITYQQAAAGLQALGVDQGEANSLVARWAASKAAASTQGILLSPWTGQPPPAPPAPQSGPIGTATVAGGGSGYSVGDTGTIAGGSGDATYQVSSVSNGSVTAFAVTNVGTAYALTTAAATTTGGAQPGTGTGFTVNIISIATT